MNTNVIKETFACSMKAGGFKKKGDSWYRHSDGVILVTNLQKSNFGEQYYVNLAVWLTDVAEAQQPKEHHCHVRVRATSLDADNERRWNDEVFNLDYTDIADSERASAIRQFLDSTAIPFLMKMGSLPQLQTLYKDGHLQGAAILARVLPHLRS